MRKSALRFGAACAFAVAAFATALPASADVDEKEFQVVGTWGNLFLWKDHESRLWNDVLPKASGGKITANAKPYTELGLSGFEVMRLLKLGTYDAVHGLTSYTSQDSVAIEGTDLAGAAQDFVTYRKLIDAYRPIIARELEDKYNAKLLMMYAFPSQQFWCNLGDVPTDKVSLDSLKGKKIRSYSTTLGDFIEGVGGTPVTIPFAEVMPALEKGVADCGITGTTPAYSAKWYQVVTHNIRVRIGYAATFLAMNMDTWNSLSDDTKKLMQDEITKVEDEIWTDTQKMDQIGMDCNADGPCPLGEELGGMTPVEPTKAEEEKIAEIVQNVVLKRWANRCGAECAKEWNETAGKVVGLEAKP